MASEYKDTLNLPKTDFPMKSSPDAEKTRIATWKVPDIGMYAGPRLNYYTLHDGPPFANGDIHLGHVLNKVLKDIDMRFHRLTGKVTEYRPGWDCHGLPIENKVKEVNRKLNLGEVTGETLKLACAGQARMWVDTQREQFKRLGINGNWEHPYLTMEPKYEEQVKRIWNILKDQGLTYKAKRPNHWSVEHQTALALAELEYKEITQTSAYVALPMVGFHSPRHLLVWTTTPWSLPGNIAVAVNPELEYDLVQFGVNQYWVASALSDKVFEQPEIEVPDGYAVLRQVPYLVQKSKGSTLVGRAYELPFGGGEAKVVAADFVTATAGTGLVHIAPAHGKDDYELALKENLPIPNPIGQDARFNDTAPEFLRTKKVWEGEKLILDNLKERRLLYKTEDITHEYPHDWRSGKPVITIATEQIFIALDKPWQTFIEEREGIPGATLRQRSIKALDEVEFVSPGGRDKLTKLLTERPDWCVSRQRLWGIQIPGETDIFDVWFESGCSFHTNYTPNVVYFEGVDQYRGWFQHSLLVSVAATSGFAPFRKVVDHGFIVGPDGKKLSKSDPNYVPAVQTLDKLGAEPVRLWVLSNDFRKDITASPKQLQEFVDKYNKVRNTVRYLISNLYDYDGNAVDAPAASLDGWMRYRAYQLLKNAHAAYDKYEYHRVFQMMFNFCTQDLSAIYANAMKDRLYCSAADSVERRRAQATMHYVYSVLLEVLEPALPMMVEEAKEHRKPIVSRDVPSEARCTFRSPTTASIVVETSETWDVLMSLRDEALLSLDAMKKQHGLNKATDAKVIYYLREPEKFAQYGADLEDIVGAGFHETIQNEKDHVIVVDTRGEYEACQRSWKRRPDVRDGLSERDRKVVESK